jgi:hypothetical protein
MEYDPKDNEVVHLLKKLKDSNGAYPPDMLALRRQGYMRQVSEVGAAAGLAMGLKNMAKGGKGAAGLSSATGTVVEALLIIALVAEAGVASYFYRDKIAEYFRSATNSPRVEEVVGPPIVTSPLAEMQLTPSPVVTTVTSTRTLTPSTPSGTPSLEFAAGTTQPNGANGVAVQPASTNGSTGNTGGPSPSVLPQDPNGNNGNHYGQTPQPVRTKEPGNNTGSTQEGPTNKKKP